MRLMSWNVLWRFEPDWRARQRGILSVLDDIRPDLLGLQECWGTADGSQALVIAEHLGMYAAFVAPSLPPTPDPPEDPDQRGASMGVGLVSRWPIVTVRHHALPVSRRQPAPMALEARIRTDDGRWVEVIVAATEWEPEFADDHLAQTRRLAELLGDGSSVRFLLADLNCDRSQPEFDPLSEVADDTWERGGGDPARVTLSSAVPFAPLEAVKEIDRRVDHILVRRTSKVSVDGTFIVDTPIDGTYPSDHFPVVADLSLTS